MFIPSCTSCHPFSSGSTRNDAKLFDIVPRRSRRERMAASAWGDKHRETWILLQELRQMCPVLRGVRQPRVIGQACTSTNAVAGNVPVNPSPKEHQAWKNLFDKLIQSPPPKLCERKWKFNGTSTQIYKGKHSAHFRASRYKQIDFASRLRGGDSIASAPAE